MHLANGPSKWWPEPGCLIPEMLRESLRSDQGYPAVEESASSSGPHGGAPRKTWFYDYRWVSCLHPLLCSQQASSCVVVPTASPGRGGVSTMWWCSSLGKRYCSFSCQHLFWVGASTQAWTDTATIITLPLSTKPRVPLRQSVGPRIARVLSATLYY